MAARRVLPRYLPGRGRFVSNHSDSLRRRCHGGRRDRRASGVTSAGTVEIHFDANNHERPEPKTVLDIGPRGLDRIVVRRLSPRPVIASEASRAFAEASSNRRLEHRFAGQQGRVTSVAISPNGDTGCSASRDGTVRFWSVNSGREVGRLDLAPEQVSQLCFSPDGNHIALPILPQTVVVRDVATGNEVRRYSLQRDAAAVAFSASKDRFWPCSATGQSV